MIQGFHNVERYVKALANSTNQPEIRRFTATSPHWRSALNRFGVIIALTFYDNEAKNMPSPLVECIPNFSEARRPEVVEAILQAISAVPGVHVSRPPLRPRPQPHGHHLCGCALG
jgi:hypothetical protein